MTNTSLLSQAVFDKSFQQPLEAGLRLLPNDYLNDLQTNNEWLPGKTQIFNAFTLPLNKIKVVLLGESPYPRKASANGYAFWDQAVTNLWSENGLSKPVNRATSLRNFIKMLLVTRGCLTPENTSQDAIAALNKNAFIDSNEKLFQKLINEGFLLLNACPVLSKMPVTKESRIWLPFLKHIIQVIHEQNPNTLFLLLGNIAKKIQKFPFASSLNSLEAEHPYNISFIHNLEIQQFFRPFDLLKKEIPLNHSNS